MMEPEERINILMVDDQPGKLLSYEVILAELGENLIKAHSGREALDHLLRTDIAVVLMDVSMPEIDGFELADMIRQHPRFQSTAIIFISAVHLTDLDRVRAYERGAVDYISVPVIPELLRAKVSVFAELHRKTNQLEKLNQELRLLSARLLVAQDDERRRIARELHDGLGQELSAAKMMADAWPVCRMERKGGERMQQHHRQSHPADSHHVPSSASSFAGRDRTEIGIGALPRGTQRTQRHQGFHEGGPRDIPTAQFRNGDSHLSHRPGGVNKRLATFRGRTCDG
jgi:CheY-like chemotaxis protein